MLTRRQLVIGLVVGTALTGPAWARDFASEIERRLTRQGYEIESVARTLLGRVRILARNADGEREIILNPRTGEILRDLWISGGRSGQSSILNDDDDDDRDDDDDDDEDDEDDDGDDGDDNSGSGSGGSDSGGGDGDDD